MKQTIACAKDRSAKVRETLVRISCVVMVTPWRAGVVTYQIDPMRLSRAEFEETAWAIKRAAEDAARDDQAQWMPRHLMTERACAEWDRQHGNPRPVAKARPRW